MQLLYAIPAAMGLGALHSLEPGHGKGILSAYLISNRGKTKDALRLGVISAASHTLSILLLAFVTTLSVNKLVPEQLLFLIELCSGAVVTAMGVRMLYSQFLPQVVVIRKLGAIEEHGDHHHHHHHHHHFHQLEHMESETPNSLRRLCIVGFFTGLIPCPSALAILLASIGIHQFQVGVGLVVAFSAGMALTMCTIGILVVHTGEAVSRLDHWRIADRFTRISAILVCLLGCFVVYGAVRHIL
ncbi:urease accessory protein UreH domain-containing protein [Alicyclobacillus suci]|uniref:HoxN/HupN/NixA family nickel/cobalt transporter n=1 Tax=Alicyclobacillus suci TaxID=2816080 RepID=UPI001A8D4E69|nr:sulfite exporter TauE/SafE family protein [Alicyclobacillus suci]